MHARIVILWRRHSPDVNEVPLLDLGLRKLKDEELSTAWPQIGDQVVNLNTLDHSQVVWTAGPIDLQVALLFGPERVAINLAAVPLARTDFLRMHLGDRAE